MRFWLFLFLSLSIAFTSCEDTIYIEESAEATDAATLKDFVFLSSNNSQHLVSDVVCEVIGDSVIACHIPQIVENKTLVPTFSIGKGRLMHNGVEVVSGVTALDCSEPVVLQLQAAGVQKTYVLPVTCFTGLPIIYINTNGRAPVESKDDYLSGTFRIVEDIVTRGAGDVFEDSVKIKGRGNSTWLMPKRPYKLKFNKKVSLLGEPADKEWVLLANYVDKTFLRNKTAFDMGHMSRLEYTNRSHFVELVLNGEYCGTYQLAEQIKVGTDRVNVGDDGYLLEVDAKADSTDVTFIVKRVGQPINIKSPEVEVGDSAYNYVVDYLKTVERVLFSDDFKDPSKGYTKYIDVASFVDWYLINEITKNNDACFYSSCYMHLARGGKLKMGPLWDYDIAFGNTIENGCESPEGFWIKNVLWFDRLFQDPNFVKEVKHRFAYFYDNRDQIYQNINDNASYLKHSAAENNNKWGTLYNYVWPNSTVPGSYENEVQVMKNWLEARFQWLNAQYSAM